jgi:quercetin dioxygenase-like cupin family protein
MKDNVSTLSEESPTALFDVLALLESLGQEERSQKGKDRTVVLIKSNNLRVVFRSLSEGSTLSTHKADGPITVQVLDGHIEFTASDQTTSLRKGHVLALRSEAPHSLRALKKSVILITVAVGGRSL